MELRHIELQHLILLIDTAPKTVTERCFLCQGDNGFHRDWCHERGTRDWWIAMQKRRIAVEDHETMILHNWLLQVEQGERSHPVNQVVMLLPAELPAWAECSVDELMVPDSEILRRPLPPRGPVPRWAQNSRRQRNLPCAPTLPGAPHAAVVDARSPASAHH